MVSSIGFVCPKPTVNRTSIQQASWKQGTSTLQLTSTAMEGSAPNYTNAIRNTHTHLYCPERRNAARERSQSQSKNELAGAPRGSEQRSPGVSKGIHHQTAFSHDLRNIYLLIQKGKPLQDSRGL